MKYVEFHGIETDIPVDRIVKSWMKAYGETRVKSWIKQFEETEGQSLSHFEEEEVKR